MPRKFQSKFSPFPVQIGKNTFFRYFRLSIAEVFEVFEVGDIDFLGDALPRDFRGVGMGKRHSIDTDEDEVGIDKVFHEGDGEAVALALQLVVVGIAKGYDLGCYVGVAIAVGESRQQFGRVALVAPIGMLVLASEQDDVGVVGHGHGVGNFTIGDAEESEVVFVGGEFLADAQHVSVIGFLGGLLRKEPIGEASNGDYGDGNE